MKKKKNNKKNEKRNNFYYDMFWELYNPDIITVGGVNWMDRIEKRHYAWHSMKQLCIVMKWFLENYHSKDNSYRLEIFHTGQLPTCITPSKKLHTRVIKENEVYEVCSWSNNTSKQYVPKFQYRYVMNEGSLEVQTSPGIYNDIKIDQLRFKK